MTALAIALSVAGGLCELAGLALVVSGIKRDRDRARKLVEAEPEPLPERTYPARKLTPTPMLYSLGDPASSDVVRKVEKLDLEVGNALVKLKRMTDAEVDAMAQRLRRERVEADAQLREGLLYMLAGSVRDRVVGVALLAVGIGLSVAGNVFGALAT